jgi:hypothetical protein
VIGLLVSGSRRRGLRHGRVPPISKMAITWQA